MPTHLPKRITTLLVALSCFAINPFILQGCFLRCPEIKPYDFSPLQEKLKASMGDTFTIMSDDGVLELKVDAIGIGAPQSYYTKRAQNTLDFIQPALAMPACQKTDGPPSSYIISMILTATWIPNNKDAVILSDKVYIQDTSSSSSPQLLNMTNDTTSFSQAEFQGPPSDSNWTLKFVMNQGKYRLDSGSLSPKPGKTQWTIQFSGDTINTLEEPPK